jgi:type IV pilus assembly protein PilV
MKHRTRRHAGFSLVEVMVALVVVSIGLLGIAKMQALALANTSSSRMRSLASIAAASLGSAMHANRNYWTATVASFTVTVSSGGAVVSTSDSSLNSTAAARPSAASNCTATATPCTAAQMAAQDLGDWADNVYVSNATRSALLPNGTTTITCTPQSLPTVTPPVVASCQIAMTWNESRIASNGVAAAADKTALQNTAPTLYTLRVNP